MRYALMCLVILARTAAAQETRDVTVETLPTIKIVRVTYAPGGSSKPHHHECPVMAYVVSGALRSKVGDGPDSTYTAGQTFYEAPGQEHVISANASREQPVTLLAYFICATH